MNEEEDGSLNKPSREGLAYLTKCMIGRPVEAHLRNGSVYTGIFLAAHVDKAFGIILKMASLIKDGGTLGGRKSISEVVRKPPMETFYIPADELVQVIAKDLSVSSDGKVNAVQSEKSAEFLTESSLSSSCLVDQRRELEPSVPDGDAPVFDNSSKSGGCDQFKVNEELFGVKSTFKEDMDTTTLDKGSQTRELEENALRIAGEIEDENTGDLHVAEERGLQINEKFGSDEEAKYSSVRPVDGFDDSGFDEEDDKLLDTCNDQTFSGSSTSNVQDPASSSGQKATSSSGKDYGGESQPFQNETNVDQSYSMSDDHAGHLPFEQRSKDFPALGSSASESQLGERRNNNNPEVAHSNRTLEESISGSGHGDIEEFENLDIGDGTSASKTVFENESEVSQVSGKTKSESSFGESASRISSESGPAPSTSTRPGLSRSSSFSSLPSSEMPTLNPNAKEFKPWQSLAPVRPQSPVAGGSFYYAARPAPFYYAARPAPVQQMPAMPVMPGMPAGYGIQPRYPEQQQLLRYPGHEYPQTYYPPNAPPEYQQWQQMMMRGQEPRAPLPPYQPGYPHNQG